MVKKHTTSHGGQKVTTYYKPASTDYQQSDAQRAQAQNDRRALNEQKKKEQSSFSYKARTVAGRVAGRIKERSREVADDLTRPNSFGSVSPTSAMPNADPFGINRANMRSGNMFQLPAGPLQQREPRRRSGRSRGGRVTTRTVYKPNGDVEVIRTGSRRAVSRDEPREREGTNIFADPFHIPKSMKHLF
jgi:hypothetical protein